MPHLAQRQRELAAGGGERSERPVVRAYDVEGAHHRLASVDVAVVGDPDVRRRRDPPWQEVLLEFLGRAERPALRVIGPGDAVGVVLGHGLEVPVVEGLVTGSVGLDVAGLHDSSCCFRVAGSSPLAPGLHLACHRLSLPPAIVGRRPCHDVGQQVVKTLKPTLRGQGADPRVRAVAAVVGCGRRTPQTPGP